ncbi:maltodextrin glucosidase [Oscillochloris sp. ZM17-4]|uniref:maltodextrin glucosidase n=1 Tax=Oscillochloris sp. ZM17-4 TaxID=2866714 RepID=UPI001C73845D|nr:maltodextrin glucosidase [Oscillochloris sp. ZM17-4]MBX0329811.1 maltodextrin glucosidase [Oscillochloris sp. ZM17-4]
MNTWLSSIHHDGSPAYVRAGGARLGAQAAIRIRADVDAPVEAVFLRTCPDGEQSLLPMAPAEAGAVCRWWQVDLPLRMLRTGYRFLLRTAAGVRWYNAAGVWGHYPTDANDFTILADYHAPLWLRDAVFYQIFPDRFADGDPSNNVRDGEYVYRGRPTVARPWGAPPRSEFGPVEFFGGDLQGVAQNLAYLEDLGVSAIYLNPIFTAPSNHKYDVADYASVDPHLGGEAALAELRAALDQRGMRLMLDIVPNHCGASHPWFVAAQADPRAPEAEFFSFRRHPDEYESWLGVASLPKLDYRSQRLRELMYAGPEAIMRRWLRPPYRIDAWRIDVANMLGRQGPSNLGHKIGRGIRRAVKAEQPEAYLLGEHFFDGTPHLQGDELDATMNYQGFTFPVWRWLAPADAQTGRQSPDADGQPMPTDVAAAQLTAFRAAIPWQIAAQQLNLLDSHDTPRLRTILGGDLARVRVAAALLFTYPGVPCVYYGDELGMEGAGDPDCRRCMPWDESTWDHDLRGFFQLLARLRRSAPALRWGGFQQLYAAGETLAFQREAPEERLIVVARRADDGLAALPVRAAGLADGARLRELLSGAEATVAGGMLPLSGLPAIGAQIWRLEYV